MVSLHRVRGSSPREAGACMVVLPGSGFHGTIGGGRLEWEALQAAQDALAAGRGPARFVDQALGPDLGQCCGGHVTLLIETFDAGDAAQLAMLADEEREGAFEVVATIAEARVMRQGPWQTGGGRWSANADRHPAAGEYDLWRPVSKPSLREGDPLQPRGFWRERYGEARTPVLLFGAGHVGRALVLALAPLPFAVRWTDSRAGAFPPHSPANATPIRAADPQTEIAAAEPGAFVLVMTHEHALDLAVTAAALARADLPFVGLIGSATKRARFERRLRDLGVPAPRVVELVCPIGLPGIAGKEPAMIAASVAAQLCLERERHAGGAKAPWRQASKRLPEEIA
jgi:xanthine dehydrogenase accessory factor